MLHVVVFRDRWWWVEDEWAMRTRGVEGQGSLQCEGIGFTAFDAAKFQAE
jgi:hypothetical protein